MRIKHNHFITALWLSLVWLSLGLVPLGLVPLNFAQAQTTAKTHHALSLSGKPKYAAGFKHFDYVNPNAPKGGSVRVPALGNFDSLNPYIIKGNPASGLSLIYDSLMTASLDEPNAQYGLIAEHVTYAADFSSVRFTLRREARFHDGKPITPDDVIWSFDAITANQPIWRAYYADIERVEKTAPQQVTFYANSTGNRELPHILGQLPILPKHYWQIDGRDISKTTLTAPLGSGAYRIGAFEAGRTITYERVKDYWARDLNVSRGQYNFDRIHYDYFGDMSIIFEAFKAGKLDFQAENNSKRWATGYDIPAITAGDIIVETPPNGDVQGMQGFVFNTRRAKFQNLAVREAFNYAFDFEWANKNLFYNQYVRTTSYFDNSELAARGLPTEDELNLLLPLRGQIPESVFSQTFRNPTTKADGNNRQNLRKAKQLLQSAGWHVEGGKLMKDGQVLEIEFLLVQAAFERVVAPFAQNLKKLGIQTRIRTIDASQYQNRLNEYDFDIIVGNFPQSLSPGNEQRNFWGSNTATIPGGRNFIGIQDAAIDKLITHIIFAKDRKALVAATRALDRVLLWNHFVIPHWHIPYHRLAYWKKLQRPDPLPLYDIGFPSIWWHAPPAVP